VLGHRGQPRDVQQRLDRREARLPIQKLDTEFIRDALLTGPRMAVDRFIAKGGQKVWREGGEKKSSVYSARDSLEIAWSAVQSARALCQRAL
jgi:hypothetical protein